MVMMSPGKIFQPNINWNAARNNKAPARKPVHGDWSSKTAKMIANYESFRSVAYKPVPEEPGWTLGYGMKTIDGKPVQQGQKIDKISAKKKFEKEVAAYDAAVKKHVKVPVKEHQLAALTSFAYNTGIPQFADSTLLKKLNAGDTKGAANEFDKWTNQGLGGLVKRRAKEKKLFYGGWSAIGM